MVSTFFRFEFCSDLSCLLFVFSLAQDIACTSKCLQYTSSLLRICDEILKTSFPDWLLDVLGIAYIVTYSFKTNDQAILPFVCNADNRVLFINLLFPGEKYLYVLLFWKRSCLLKAAVTLFSSWQHMFSKGFHFKSCLQNRLGFSF